MAEGINVRFAGTLQQFIHQRVSDSGLYSSASEYIRDLVRRDFEKENEKKSEWLRGQLQAGALAAESEFVHLDADTLIQKAKARKTPHGS